MCGKKRRSEVRCGAFCCLPGGSLSLATHFLKSVWKILLERVYKLFSKYANCLLPRMSKSSKAEILSNKNKVVTIWKNRDAPFIQVIRIERSVRIK